MIDPPAQRSEWFKMCIPGLLWYNRASRAVVFVYASFEAEDGGQHMACLDSKYKVNSWISRSDWPLDDFDPTTFPSFIAPLCYP